MADGDTIEIVDRGAFPGRITAIREASQTLRGLSEQLERIVNEADKEAASFTTAGSPAPVYAGITAGLRTWHGAVKAAIAAVCDGADNCAATADEKFQKITAADDAAAARIKNL
ncbi:hypothetical protein [Mycolicibacterium sp.]|uniref:hypothetical protein n=1 Tax=Mycolicibacterium sp. TaxID=2320850 RepID=UPI0035606744